MFYWYWANSVKGNLHSKVARRNSILCSLFGHLVRATKFNFIQHTILLFHRLCQRLDKSWIWPAVIFLKIIFYREYWQLSGPGPSGIKNFNPGIFRDGILPNPGIPGFFGTGFPNIFDPGISGLTSASVDILSVFLLTKTALFDWSICFWSIFSKQYKILGFHIYSFHFHFLFLGNFHFNFLGLKLRAKGDTPWAWLWWIKILSMIIPYRRISVKGL